MNKNINGLINAIKLKGKVGGITKTIHILMYYLTGPYSQTKCDDIRALDINTYLIRKFGKLHKKNPEKIYDFIYDGSKIYQNYDPNHKGSYENLVAEIFTKEFKIDPKNAKVSRSERIPNVRLHYTATDDCVFNKSELTLGNIENTANEIWHSRNFNAEMLEQLSENIKKIGDEIFNIGDLLFLQKDLANPEITEQTYNMGNAISPETIAKLKQKLIWKIKNSYTNESVKNIINKIINDEYKKIFDEYNDYEKKVLHTINSYTEFRKKIEVNNLYDVLFEQKDGTYNYGLDPDMLDQFVFFTKTIPIDYREYIYSKFNIYLENFNTIRKILDKNYITNVVVYKHANYAIALIRLLVKYFGFEIVGYSYLKNNDLSICNKMIMESEKHSDLKVVFLPQVINQCANVDFKTNV